jgi:hypothetical protein
VTDQLPESESVEKSLFQLTRELELLISAGLVLALLQLPGVFDEWWNRTSIHLGGTAFGTAFTMYYVGKLISYGLIVAIAAHFLLRGFWVAIMGLRTVFPGSVQREKLDHGPIFEKFYDEKLLTLEQIEDRVDRVSASIFAFVFLFLFVFLMMSVWALVAWGLAFIAMRISGSERVVMPVMAAVFLVYLLPQWYASWADRKSKNGPVSPEVERRALRAMRFLYYPTFNFVYAPVLFTLSRAASRKKINALLVGFLYAMVAVFMFSVFTARGILRYDSYIYYPSSTRDSQLRPIHYDDLRGEGEAATEPSIQSDFIEEPYLRLFMPYDAREDNERARVLCPDVKPLRDEGFFFASRGKLPTARMEQLGGCFDRLYEISIDGSPVQKPLFVFTRHQDGNVAGRLARIPVSTLKPGYHLLAVRHRKLPGVKNDDDADEFFIPFWR